VSGLIFLICKPCEIKDFFLKKITAITFSIGDMKNKPFSLIRPIMKSFLDILRFFLKSLKG